MTGSIEETTTTTTTTETTNQRGYFGEFGGSFVPPQLQQALDELDQAFLKYKDDPDFQQELEAYYREYVGRPSRLYYAERLTEKLGGAKIFLKYGFCAFTVIY